MCIDKIEFEFQLEELEVEGETTYDMIDVSAHADDDHIVIETWKETEDGTENGVKADLRWVTFPTTFLDRMISYLNLIKQWQK
ncbi:MAG: hypothetical protein EHM49_00620 [Deltaproteobacteria bacterium]|nr:MAG: hypothetical protein EHM49_00620 [Deltaproteobacteria bacterium]